MKRFDRYLCKTVLLATGAVFLAFIGLIAVFALIEEVGEGKLGYSLTEALLYVALTLPRRSYELLPYAVFLGSLVGLGYLASRWELATLRAAGVSVYRLFAGLAWVVLGLALVGALVGEWVAPEAEARAEARKARALRGGETIAIGGWYREGPLYMRVDALSPGGGLIGVRQYRLDESGALRWVREASGGSYQEGDIPHWVLRDVLETRIADAGTAVERLPEVHWLGEVDPRLLSEAYAGGSQAVVCRQPLLPDRLHGAGRPRCECVPARVLEQVPAAGRHLRAGAVGARVRDRAAARYGHGGCVSVPASSWGSRSSICRTCLRP